MASDKIDELYDALKADGLVEKDRDNFRSYMLAPGEQGYRNRLELYNALRADELVSSPTYEEFRDRLGLVAAGAGNNRSDGSNWSNRSNSGVAPSGADGTPSGVDALKPGVLTADGVDVSGAGFDARVRAIGDRVRRSVERVTPEGRSKRKVAETTARLLGADTRLPGLIGRPADNAARAEAQSDIEGASDATPDYGGLSPVVHGVKMVDGKATVEWLLPDGSVTEDRNVADMAAWGARRERLAHEFQKRMRDNGLDPEKVEDVQRQRVEDKLAQNEERLRKLVAERDAEEHRERDDEGGLMGFLTEMGRNARRSVGANVPKPEQTLTDRDKEIKDLLAANDLLDEARRTLVSGGKLKKSEGVLNGIFDFANNAVNVFRGMRDVVSDPDFVGAGVMSMHRMDRLGKIKDKMDKGLELSDSELNLLSATALNGEVVRGADLPHGYRAGATVAEMVPFMAQMMLNPASGVSKAMAKRFGKTTARRIAATVAGDVAESAVLANTLQGQKTVADIRERHMGEVAGSADGGYAFTGGESWAKAIRKGEGAAVIENFTEMLGGHFGSILAKGGKAAAGLAEKMGAGRMVERIGNFATSVKASDWGKAIGNIEKRAEWHGSLGEILEEECGIVLNSLFVGDNRISDLVDAEKQIDIALGVGLFGGVVSAFKTGGYLAGRKRAESKLAGADEHGLKVFSEAQWDNIKGRIEGADDSDLGAAIVGVIQDYCYRKGDEELVLDYAKALMIARGYNLAELSRQSEELGDSGTSEELEGSSNRSDWSNQSNPGAEAEAAGGQSEADALKPGVPAAVEDFIERAAWRDGDAEVLRPVTLKGDNREVYVVKGNIVLVDDGMIDYRGSDEVIYVYDAGSGKVKQVSKRDIASASEPVAAADIRSNWSNLSNQSNQEGVPEVDFALNDSFRVAVPGRDGTTQQAAVVDREGDRVTVWTPFALNDSSEKGRTMGGFTTDIAADELEGLLERDETGAPVDYVSTRRQTEGSNNIEEPTNRENPEVAPVEEETASEVESMPMRQVTERGETREEPDYLATTPARSHSYIYNESGLSRQEADEHVEFMAKAAKEAVQRHMKGAPKIGGSIARFVEAKAEWEKQGTDLQSAVDYWDAVKAEQRKVLDAELAVRKAQAEQARDEAQARFEEEQRVKAEKQAEQERIGINAVNPKLKAKWDGATKIVGNANAHVLADGSSISGHYVLTEAGTASASHDPNNAFQPTEGFPIDENGQNVNDRDYSRDKDAQRMVETMAGSFDSRALQTPVIVSQDGIVLSGNNRTMSGDVAARRGTDGAYVDYLKQYGSMYGFTPEQIASMRHPRVVFVPDEAMPYNSTTFSRFNAQEMKSQSKPEAAVKLGKVVPDNVFAEIVGDINRYERMSDFYANEAAAARALGALHAAGVVNDAQMPELRTGTSLSAAGKELLENTLIGKVFQSEPDAVRKVMEMPSMRQTIVMALAEIANNKGLAAKGYDLVDELSKAVDLCYRAKASNPEVYVPGVPVSPFGRMAGLFDDEYGESRVTDATTLLLADLLNDTKPSRLRNVLTVYNKQGSEAAAGAMDLFTGEIASKETILTEINNHFINATPREQQSIVDAAIAERKRRATKEQQERGGDEAVEQTADALQRSAAGTGPGESTRVSGRDSGSSSDMESAEGLNYKLSNEVDENGRQFVLTSQGGIEFGFIRDIDGLESAPILLSEGIITNKQTKDGYGLVHIEARHGEQIRGLGYGSVLEFIETVADKYQTIRKGIVRDGKQTYMLQFTDSHNNTLMVELSSDGSYYTINTAGAFKMSYGRNREIVYDRHTTAKQPVEVAEESQKPTQSDTSDDSRMNSPTQSEGKVNALSGEKQAESEESLDFSPGDKRGEDVKPGASAGHGGKGDASAARKAREIAAAEAAVNTNPTEAQKKAGNYKMGHFEIDGLEITIENPKGSVRRGTDAGGKAWETKMNNTYGYIKGTTGVDGDNIDIFISDSPTEGNVYVVDQFNTDGTFDEHKVMYGFNSATEAEASYLSNYSAGWARTRLVIVTGVDKAEFKKWLASSKRKTKPFAEYKAVRVLEEQEGGDVFFRELCGFAKEFKEVAQNEMPKLQKKLTKWIAAQPDSKLVVLSTAVMRAACAEAGLDAGKAWAMRMCIDKAIPVERVNVIWEGRNRRSSEEINQETANNRENRDIEKNETPESIDKTTDTDDNPSDLRGGTALSQNSDVSEGKDRTLFGDMQAGDPNNGVNQDRPDMPNEADRLIGAVPRGAGGHVEISDEMLRQEAELRRLLGLEDGPDMVKEPGILSRGDMRRVYSLGVDYAFNFLDSGVTRFEDFARAIVGRLGDGVKPFVKSWYEGAKRVPGYGGEGYSSTAEVERFNMETMNGEGYDVLRDAAECSRELQVKTAAGELSEADRIVDEFCGVVDGIFKGVAGLSDEEAAQSDEAIDRAVEDYYVRLTEQLEADGADAFDAGRIAREMISRAMADVAEAHRIVEARRAGLQRGHKHEDEAYSAIEKPKDGAEVYGTRTGESVEFLSYGKERKLAPGEVCYVERQFTKTGEYNFTGSDRVESADDVAYIFRQLESFSTEHSFAVVVKDGVSRIIHVGMGNEVGTVVSATAIRAASDAMGGADKVYFVHNHPGGVMKPSAQDMVLIGKLQRMMPGVVEDGIIIDTLSGQYCVFDSSGLNGRKDRPASGGERPLPVYRFNHTAFREGYDAGRSIMNSEDAAEIISSLRLGQRDKRCMLVLNNANVVVGSFVLGPHGSATELAEEAVELSARFGGRRMIFFGNRAIAEGEWLRVQAEVDRLSGGDMAALDNITVVNGLNSEASIVDRKDAMVQKELFGDEIAQAEVPVVKKAGQIEDFGEVLEGARKDALKNMARMVDDVSVEALVKLPLAQVFKRLNIAELLESEAVTRDEAIVIEAMSLAVLANKKPVTGRSTAAKRPNSATARREAETMAKWAHGQKAAIERIGSYLKADGAGRRAIEAELERAVTDAGAEVRIGDFGVKKKVLNPGAVMHYILKGCDFEPGQKVVPVNVDLLQHGSYWFQPTGKNRMVSVGRNVDEALAMVKAAFMLKNGIGGAQLPVALFAPHVTKYDMVATGEYRVSVARGMKIEDHKFGSPEEAEAFKKNAEGTEGLAVSSIHEIKKTGAPQETVLRVKDPIKHEWVDVDAKFTTPEEARGALDADYERLNAKACEAVMANNKIKRRDRVMFAVRHFPKMGNMPEEWGVVYANSKAYSEMISSHGSEAEAKAAAAKLEAQYKAMLEQRRKHVFFTPGAERRGEDYRGGKDATPEMYDEAFGFRGVQFGNWTNQRDRQAAMNQAYDGFMDLARVLGVPSRALSLGGELGIAFGARGSGSALAHYEPGTVVINLTKTKGEGSLAHEWWHALDNYIARHGGMSGGYATEVDIEGMRGVTQDAFRALRHAIQKSNYQARSDERGTYWGSMRELTARLFAQWVDYRLNKDGESSPFLSRGVDPEMLGRFKEFNWALYNLRAVEKKRYGGEVKKMSREEFMQSPEALRGYVEVTPEELESLGPLLETLFRGLEIEESAGKLELREPEDVYDDGIGLEYEAEGADNRSNWSNQNNRESGPENPAGSTEADIEAVNERFNSELQQYEKGTLPQGHRFELGMPSRYLRSAGFPNLPISMRTSLLNLKSGLGRHPFEAKELRGLVEAIQTPIAVFSYTKDNVRNIIVDVKHGNKHFLVGVTLNYRAGNIEINSVSGLFPKDNHEWLKWIQDGKAIRIDQKEKVRQIIDSLRMNPGEAERIGLNLDDVAKVVNSFENPAIEGEKTDGFVNEPAAEYGAGGHVETLEEKLLRVQLMVAERHGADVAVRDAAVESLGKTLGNIRRTMQVQHTYDVNTARALEGVARVLMETGTFMPESRTEIKRLMGVIRGSMGRTARSERDFHEAVDSLMDLLVDNQLKLAGRFLDEMLAIKGSKVNARGVEVMGQLDVEGQIMVRSMNEFMGKDAQTIRDRIATLDDIIAGDNEAAAMNAAAEKLGVELARQYVEEVAERASQELLMSNELRDMKEQWNSNMSGDERKAYIEQRRALRESIRKIRIERADALRALASNVGNDLRNSIERVRAFREQEKQRIEDIWHNANSDMAGRAFDEHGMKDNGPAVKLSNNMVARLLMAPAATFEQVMRVFGRKSINGEGYLYDRFVRGWQKCRDIEWKQTQAVEQKMNEKAAEVLGKKGARWSDLYALTKEDAGMCEWWDGGEVREHKVTQGNLMYIYMVNKMTDGQVKLRRMRITEDKMREVESALNPKLRAVADWLQDEFLPKQRNRYNRVHVRMFGAPMAEIDNYFPLKILANARIEEVEMAGKIDGKDLPKTMTGAIIKRRYNNYALDVLGSDAVSVALDHVREMETWAAFAEYRRDLCTLLSYKHFRNQVKNMTTIYGSGEKFWDKFYDLSLLVGGAYKPKTSEFDKVAVNLTKLATGACIAIRLNTALKQLLSYPAFGPEANVARLMYNMTPWRARECWKWAMENMPSFERRWMSRQAGNDLLREWKHDWDWTRTEFVQKIQRAGITPNAFIDALTVSMGAEAVYHRKLKEYIKDGFGQEDAHRKAIEDAEITFNLSQQSSEVPYLSLLQNDRSYLTTCITNFRNSPMSYLRQSIQSKRELINMMKSKDMLMEFETKKGVREGLSEEQARARAERKYRRNWARNVFKSATYDFILPALWYFGLTGAWYCIFGDDDEKKKELAADALKRGTLGGFEGLTFGGTLPDFAYGLITGSKPQLDEESSPAMGLVSDMLNLYSNGKTERAANEMINTMVALGVGVNPQVIEDAVVAGMDFFGQDENNARDWALLAMRVLSCPQSQMDQIYFDELGMTAGEAASKSPAELAERYATYKARRANFATMWAYDDDRWEDEVKKPWRKKFEAEAKARLGKLSEAAVNEKLEAYDAELGETRRKVRELDGPFEDMAAKAAALFDTPEGRRYQIYNDMKPYLDKMIKSWLNAESAEAAATEAAAIVEYKARVVEMLDAWDDADRCSDAGQRAMDIVREWHERESGE